MTFWSKVWLTIVALLPNILLMVAFVAWAGMAYQNLKQMDAFGGSGGELNPEYLKEIGLFVIGLAVLGLIALVVRIFLMIDIAKRYSHDISKMMLWMVVVLFVGVIGEAIYLMVVVWPLPQSEAAAQRLAERDNAAVA